MPRAGVEPATYRSSGGRSNQLSYLGFLMLFYLGFTALNIIILPYNPKYTRINMFDII